MRPIRPQIRQEMAEDPFYEQCCFCGTMQEIQWHHVWIYEGRQIDEKWAIVPACARHHRELEGNIELRQFFEMTSMMLATEEDLAKYPLKNWHQIKINLNFNE